MENKRSILIIGKLLAFATIPLFVMAFTDIQTPQSIIVFYGGMEKLSSTSDENTAAHICRDMKNSFYPVNGSSSGPSIPNDFKYFKYDDNGSVSHNDNTVSSSIYVDKLRRYLFTERKMKVNYKILGSEVSGESPDFNKGRLTSSASIINTYITKTYNINGFEKVFNDTVQWDISSELINDIKNGSGNLQIVDVRTLRIKAALAYKQKRYLAAYKTYEQILSLAPQDEDALYRIGLMTYYQQGCFLSKRTAHNKGISYMKDARIYSDYRSPIKEKAENVLHHWEYWND